MCWEGGYQPGRWCGQRGSSLPEGKGVPGMGGLGGSPKLSLGQQSVEGRGLLGRQSGRTQAGESPGEELPLRELRGSHGAPGFRGDWRAESGRGRRERPGVQAPRPLPVSIPPPLGWAPPRVRAAGVRTAWACTPPQGLHVPAERLALPCRGGGSSAPPDPALGGHSQNGQHELGSTQQPGVRLGLWETQGRAAGDPGGSGRF